MKEMSISNLKMNFSSILDEVEKGETIIITRYKKRVAVLLNYEEWLSLTKQS